MHRIPIQSPPSSALRFQWETLTTICPTYGIPRSALHVATAANRRVHSGALSRYTRREVTIECVLNKGIRMLLLCSRFPRLHSCRTFCSAISKCTAMRLKLYRTSSYVLSSLGLVSGYIPACLSLSLSVSLLVALPTQRYRVPPTTGLGVELVVLQQHNGLLLVPTQPSICGN